MAIAQALILKPPVLLMDEAFSALDPGTRTGMQRLIKELWRESGTTIVFVTHNTREALCLGTRVIALAKDSSGERGSSVALDLSVPHLDFDSGEEEIHRVIREVESATIPAVRASLFTIEPSMSFYKTHAPRHREHTRPLPDFADLEGMRALREEKEIPIRQWQEEVRRGKEFGLECVDSIEDKTEISCFQRGELPHWSGINTFLKTHYLEDVRKVGEYDVAFMGVPFDIGTTYRAGTRFGPQGIRRISSLYTTYNFELGVDLRESLKMCDIGDVFCPANITKSHDQITKGVAHVLSQGALPMIMGGDHSIGYPCVRGVAQCIEGKVGIIHLDRHIDTQEKDMDEIMHTCPWFHATNIPNCPPTNLVQVGIGGWQVPRPGVKKGRERGSTVLTIQRHRANRHRQDRRDRAGSSVEGRVGSIPVLRRRFRGCRIRAWHRLAGAGGIPATRSARDSEGSGQGRCRGHGGSGGFAALRYLRHHGVGGRARDGGCACDHGQARTNRRKTHQSSIAFTQKSVGQANLRPIVNLIVNRPFGARTRPEEHSAQHGTHRCQCRRTGPPS